MICLFHEFPYISSGLHITHFLEGLSFISTQILCMYTFIVLRFATRAFIHLDMHVIITCRSGSSVGIDTDNVLEGRGSNPCGARFSARPDRPWGPPSLLYNGYRVFPRGKVRPGCAADHSPPF